MLREEARCDELEAERQGFEAERQGFEEERQGFASERATFESERERLGEAAERHGAMHNDLLQVERDNTTNPHPLLTLPPSLTLSQASPRRSITTIASACAACAR